MVECLAAAGCRSSLVLNGDEEEIRNPGETQPDVQAAAKASRLSQLDQYLRQHEQQWLFGHVGYYFGDEVATVRKPDPTGFPDLFFFQPEIVIRLSSEGLSITGVDPELIFSEITRPENVEDLTTKGRSPIHIRSRLDRQQYIDVIEKLRSHILRGDCYEINYCMEFFADDVDIDPLEVYNRLGGLSPNPFSSMYRIKDRWLLCASPERYLKRAGDVVISQPIKGTSRRKVQDGEVLQPSDAQDRDKLYHSAKDRSENVMVVDLVRNDLSRFCIEGSVEMEELYGIYTFPQVHQMISTIRGRVVPGTNFADMLRHSFPMGSMTGAPKRRVMELIGQYEDSARGLFSGSLGYIAPSGDLDFNVVIRSILYNQSSGHLSMPAGSGITFYSNAADEWEECQLKAEAMQKAIITPQQPF